MVGRREGEEEGDEGVTNIAVIKKIEVNQKKGTPGIHETFPNILKPIKHIIF